MSHTFKIYFESTVNFNNGGIDNSGIILMWHNVAY